MVSRRKILSRSRDDLNLELAANQGGTSFLRDEEDVWYQKEKLYKVIQIYCFFRFCSL